jgi:nucleoside-diphosphate-sugar epimerase
MSNRKRIIVTGATGFLGSNVTPRLLEHADVGIVTRPHSSFDAARYTTTIVDTGDVEELVANVQEFQPHACLHFAASSVTAPKSHQINELIESNIAFGTRIAHAFAEARGKTFLYVSSFSQHANGEAYRPTILYAATKQAMADILRYYAINTFQVIDLQLFDTFGPGDTRPKIWNLLMKAANDNVALDTTEGQQFIFPIHIHDVARAVTKALELSDSLDIGYHEYRVMGPQAVRLREAVDIFEQANNITIPLNWGVRPYIGNEMFEPWEYGQPLPNWSPEISLPNGFRELWQEFQKSWQ